MAYNNSSTNSCHPLLSLEDLEILGFTQASLALVSIASCVFIYIIMLIFKKYVYSAQRLFLYLTSAILLNSISHVVRGYGYRLISNSTFCEIMGFLDQYTGACILAAVSSLIIHIFIRVVLKKVTDNLEPLYIVIIFVVPAAVNWLPFISHGYGPTDSWCWIRNKDLSTCDTFTYGLVLQYVLWYIPVFGVTIVGGVIYIVSLVTIKRQNIQYTALMEPDRLQLQRAALNEIKEYRWYPLLYLLLNLIPFIARAISDINSTIDILPLWIVSSAVQGLQGGFVAILFSIDAETRKRLSWRHIKNGIRYNVLKFEDTVEYPALTTEANGRRLTDSLAIS